MAFTYHTAQNGTLGKCVPERVFVAHSILDEHDACLVFVDRRSQLLCRGPLIDCLVCADDVVVSFSCLCRRLDHYTWTINTAGTGNQDEPHLVLDVRHDHHGSHF
jgi:hypothetical protein